MVTTSETLGSLVASSDSNKVGPDTFAFYTSEVKRLLSQNEDFLPFATKLMGNICGEGESRGNVEFEPSSGSFFSDSIRARLSDHKKERLNSLLRQCLAVLAPEADEMLDPVLRMHQLQSHIRNRKMGTLSENETGQTNKRIKLSSSFSTSFSKPDSPVDDDLQFLLQGDSSLVEQAVKKYSDQLFTTLNHMEKHLEELLDTVASTCRTMTLTEKQHLQKLIKQLPPKNLNRVVEILQHSKPEAQSGKEIFVDLEQEDNTTLWRLHYYVEAVEKARKLSS